MRPKYERKFGHDIGMATPMELSSHTDPFAVVPGFGVYGSVEPPYADAMPVDQLMPGSGAGLGAGSGSGEGSGAGARRVRIGVRLDRGVGIDHVLAADGIRILVDDRPGGAIGSRQLLGLLP